MRRSNRGGLSLNESLRGDTAAVGAVCCLSHTIEQQGSRKGNLQPMPFTLAKARVLRHIQKNGFAVGRYKREPTVAADVILNDYTADSLFENTSASPADTEVGDVAAAPPPALA